MKKLLILSISLLLISCADPDVHRYKGDIVSVYFHEGNDYSVGIMNGSKLDIVRLPPSAHVDVFLDADPSGSMWYECDHTRDRFMGETTGGCSIHAFDIDDINTGGWNHGKFGSGKTTRAH